MREIYYKEKYKGIEPDEYYGEAYLSYWIAKMEYAVNANYYSYWDHIYRSLENTLECMRKERNKSMRFNGEISLNQTFGDGDTPAETFLFPGKGDFTNGIALYDWVERLESIKKKIVRLMLRKEDDDYIMRVLHLDSSFYYRLKGELQEEYAKYQDIR